MVMTVNPGAQRVWDAMKASPPRRGGSSLDLRSAFPNRGVLSAVGDDLKGRSKCRRGGVVKRVCDHGRDRELRVSCKAWDCRSCAASKVSKVKGVIQCGLWTLQNCVLMTLTWHLDDRRTRDAEYVRRTLSRLWEELRKRYPSLEYLYVKETSKRGQLHIHALVSQWTGPTMKHLQEWEKSRFWLSQSWRAITNRVKSREPHPGLDSFIVDVRPVRNKKGVPSYLTKYLTKAAKGHWRKNFVTGYRWASSRGWPRASTREIETNAVGNHTTMWQYHQLDKSMLDPTAEGRPPTKGHGSSGCADCEPKVMLWEAGKVTYLGELVLRPRFSSVDHPFPIRAKVHADVRASKAKLFAALTGSRFGNFN